MRWVNRLTLRCNRGEEIVVSDEKANQRKRELLRKYNNESNRVARESVETALLLLMEEKDFASISITDIVARAGVSRSAYYRNYATKEAILASVFDQSVDAILETIRLPLQEAEPARVYVQLFHSVQEKVSLFKIIQQANLQWAFQSRVSEHLMQRIPDGQYAKRYQLCSWIGATVNVLFLWISRGMQESPEEMAQIFRNEIRGELAPWLI